MNNIKAAASILQLMVTLPIWFYLLYQIMERVNASELMFFLFWIYVPFQLLTAFLVRLLDD